MAKEKPHINLVVIGHVDSGKSSAAAHLSYLCGGFPEGCYRSRKPEQDQPVRVLELVQTLRDDSLRGMNIKLDWKSFWGPKRNYTISDVSGNQNDVQTLVYGVSNAHVALLVVSAVVDEWEAALSKEGQMRQQLQISHCLGMQDVVVAVTKMDHPSVSYSQIRFLEVVTEVKLVLKSCGFNPDKCPIIPVSGSDGDNITEKSFKLSWFEGPSLLLALEDLPTLDTLASKPFRMPVSGVFQVKGQGTVVTGRIESGSIKLGMQVCFGPIGIVGTCHQLQSSAHEMVTEASAGINVGICFKDVDHLAVKKGYVASDFKYYPAASATEFVAMITVLKNPGLVTKGWTPVVECHTAKVPCRVVEIKCKLEKNSGKATDHNPTLIHIGDSLVVMMVPTKPMIVECLSHYPALGRFTIKDHSEVVAVGTVLEVLTNKVETGC